MEIEMNAKAIASEYRGWPSLVLESELVRMVLIPQLGAKIVSLCYKPTGKEWLLDAGERELKQANGLSFGQLDMSGWDECFPTIDTCSIELEGAVNSMSLPDHGEVWAQSWEAAVVSDSVVTCSVKGIALPYELSRTIAFADADTLRMDYRVVNLGDQPLPFLWVPHPQFAVTEPTRIELPLSEDEAICVSGGLHHRTGEHYPWEELSLIDAACNGDGHKYYAPDKWQEGWCGLFAPDSGNWLRMYVDPQQVPYFGVWIDEGMYNDRNVITLEPSIGYYDSLARAVANGSARYIASGETFEWSMDLRLGTENGSYGRSRNS